MKVLLTGATGQVGVAVSRAKPAEAELLAYSHEALDIGDLREVETLLQATRPDLVINAAAYTKVDLAEKETDAAHRANAAGPRNLAVAATAVGARLIHLSTDYVFAGDSSRAYAPEDAPAPLGAYGRTKLEGEEAVRSLQPAGSIVLRTAWVYAASGRNFVRTMLQAMKERGAVRVVADQIGTPTCADSIAQVLWRFAARPDLSGVYHWTDAGVASWYDFAVAIAEEAAALGRLPANVAVTPIATSEYPTPARRPRFSLLDSRTTVASTGLAQVHWRVQLRHTLREIQFA